MLCMAESKKSTILSRTLVNPYSLSSFEPINGEFPYILCNLTWTKFQTYPGHLFYKDQVVKGLDFEFVHAYD